MPKCIKCGETLRNNLYGSRCEDCYILPFYTKTDYLTEIKQKYQEKKNDRSKKLIH